MNTIYVLIAAGQRCAIVWRPRPEGTRQTSQYWLTTSSLQRLGHCVAQGQLVCIYHDQHTYLLQGGAA